MDRLRVMRQNGEIIGYVFAYLGQGGHIVNVRVHRTEQGVHVRHEQYGSAVPMPDPMPPLFADMLGRAMQRAARMV